MTKTTDLNPARSEKHRQWEKFKLVPVLIILTSVLMIAVPITWSRAERAIDLANAAQATAETWQALYSETERECRLAQMEIDNFKIMMAKAGLNVDHHGEKP